MQKRHRLIMVRSNHQQSRRDMATALNITEAYYGMIECGTRQPALDLAQRIAALMGSTVEELFGDEHQLDAKKPQALPEAFHS